MGIADIVALEMGAKVLKAESDHFILPSSSLQLANPYSAVSAYQGLPISVKELQK